MWKLDFKISGLPADDGERRSKRNNDTARNRNATWLVAGLVIAYLLGSGVKSGAGLAIVLPTSGTSTLEPQIFVVGKVTGGQSDPVTLRVKDTTLTVPVADGVFQTTVTLDVGPNDIRASSGGIESEPITIIRKPRPTLRIDTPPAVSQTQEPEIGVAGTVTDLEGDSITLEVNGTPQALPTSGGRFSTKVQLPVVGANTIRALASGTDPVLVTVLRSEPNKPAIAITSPESETTTVMDSVTVKGTVVNSDVPEITLTRNLIPAKVKVRSGTFEARVSLDRGRNYLQAFVGEVPSGVVLIDRKLPPRIEIKFEAPANQMYLESAYIRSVKISGIVQNLDTQNVSMRVNNEPRGMATVSNGKFEFDLKATVGAFYRIQAYLGEYVSNELVIPSSQQTEPKTPQQKKEGDMSNFDKGAKKP